MASAQRKIKNFQKYQEKRSKEEIRKSLYNQIQQASVGCELKPEIVKKKTSKKQKKIKNVLVKMQQIKRLGVDSVIKCENLSEIKSTRSDPEDTSFEAKSETMSQEENSAHDSFDHLPLKKSGVDLIRKPAQTRGFVFNRSKTVIEARQNLPIFYQEDEIVSAIKNNGVVFIDGFTGCGKSTQIPQMLLEHGFTNILITQPRKISCINIANRINYETAANLCSYRYRFGNNVHSGTKIEIVTEGILLKEFVNDIKLSKYQTIIIDESHDITVNLDLLIPMLALLIKTRSDLRLIFMSATQNDKILRLFSDAPTVEIKSTLYPVRTFHEDDDVVDIELLNSKSYKEESLKLEDQIVKRVEGILRKDSGDILVFLASKDQIYSLLTRFKKKDHDCVFLPIHASLSQEEQQNVFKDVRKCIFSTNYAETGLTIPGICHVIDTGLQKICKNDGHVREYKTIYISKASAEQRKGRAGRTADGKCYRMYTPATFERMTEHNLPSTRYAPIDFHILLLYFFKIKKQIFFNPIPEKHLQSINLFLQQINAIKEGKITKIGKNIVQSKFSPRIAALCEQQDTKHIRLVAALMDSDLEIEKIEVVDVFSEIFTKIDHFLENFDTFPYQKRNEILKLAEIKNTKLRFTSERKLRISKCLFIVFYDHLCHKIDGDYYFNTQKLKLSNQQKAMACEHFVFQYLLKKNDRFYPVNITKVDSEWLDLDKFTL
ncbi:RNA helicase, nucleoside-triphosphatase [Pseudoloma neurophilia]|uniref:RNA helicase, nucleoside-triphosphatase n=1 Tax=Pseudoloma neurophilia TaxID=146866 RepID=A0A0R0M5M2_9MICR|nr:RNA helicase, nucleoside-triphosphatase [Pseudoloma neurophilia]